MDRTALIPELLELFRQHGYEGVSIAHVSKATGLGKSSLYHHFPQGKEQMAMEVLAYINAGVKEFFIAPLQSDMTPAAKLEKMAENISAFYDEGRKSCIVDGLTLGDASAPFHKAIGECLEAWMDAIVDVAIEAGINKTIARERAENVLIAIEGSLVVARAMGNTAVFKRVVQTIPSLVLNGGNQFPLR